MRPFPLHKHGLPQSWTVGLAIVLLFHGTMRPFEEHRRPPSKKINVLMALDPPEML